MSGEIVPFTARESGPPEPCNTEVEQHLLGAFLFKNPLLERAPFLKTQHFSSPVHQRIFAAIERLVGESRIANPLTLAAQFDQDGALQEVGGSAYLVRLAANAAVPGNVPDYARLVHDLWRRREIVTMASGLRDAALSGDVGTKTGEIISIAERTLHDLIDASPAQGGPEPIALGIDSALQHTEAAIRGEATASISTELDALDDVIGGLRAPRLYILGGRPAMGKSTVAKTIAFAAARAGVPVLIFSMEMSRQELSWWLLADVSGMSANRQERGDMTADEFDDLNRARAELDRLPLFIDERAHLTMTEIRATARKFMRRRSGPALLIVDHLGLISASPEAQRQGPTAEVTEITRGLKVLAKDLDVPVLALCQLNRGLEARDDKRPTLADLRQSGSIEQDADAVLFIYRAEYYEAKNEPLRKSSDSDEKFNGRMADWQAQLARVRGLAQIIVAKQRGGPEGVATVKWDPQRSRVANLHGGNA